MATNTKKKKSNTVTSVPNTSPVTIPVIPVSGPVVGGVPVAGLTGLRASLSAMAQGWSTMLPAGSTLPSNDGGYNQAAILSQLNGWITLYTTVDQTHASWTTAVAQLKSVKSGIRAELQQLKSALKAYFGNGSPELANFGIKPAKPRAKPTAAATVVRTAKAEETKKLRNTMSAKQKAQVKFQGQLVSQVTPVAAATPAAPQPAEPVSPGPTTEAIPAPAVVPHPASP